MSTRDRRAREAADLRQRILDAALRVFTEEGYEQVSMRKIAARIDYSATTIYRFFQNKDDLLWAIAAGTYQELAGRFARHNVAERAPEHRLKALVLEYMEFCIEHADMYRLLSERASFELEDGVLYERLGNHRQGVFQSWRDAIQEGMALGRIEAASELEAFMFLWDAADGYIFHRIRHPELPRRPGGEDAQAFLGRLLRSLEPTVSPS